MVAMAELVPGEIYEAIGRLCAYYASLEGAVAQAIWLELEVAHDLGHPITDRLQLREAYKLLIDLHKVARRKTVVDHLQAKRPQLERLMEARNLVVHGTVVFSGLGDRAGIKWLMRRGAYNRKPHAVTLAFVDDLIGQCQVLVADIQATGRF